MLARLAESLYWMGRYLERVEHLARYLKVQYFSTMDAPIELPRFFVSTSLINVAGSEMEIEEDTIDEDILFEVALNTENPNSIISCIIKCRENAQAIRPSISSELWESINSLYHFAKSYDTGIFKNTGLYDFTTKTLSFASMFKALVNGTMLHDESWHFIRLGNHIECTTQINRILSNKVFDIERLSIDHEIKKPLENYQWVTTLIILEGLDVSRKIYKKAPNKTTTSEFLISNTQFTRSLAYNFEYCHHFIKLLSNSESNTYNKNSLEFKCAKLAADYKFIELSNEHNLELFLEETNDKISDLHRLIDQNFFYKEDNKSQSQTNSNSQ